MLSLRPILSGGYDLYQALGRSGALASSKVFFRIWIFALQQCGFRGLDFLRFSKRSGFRGFQFVNWIVRVFLGCWPGFVGFGLFCFSDLDRFRLLIQSCERRRGFGSFFVGRGVLHDESEDCATKGSGRRSRTARRAIISAGCGGGSRFFHGRLRRPFWIPER